MGVAIGEPKLGGEQVDGTFLELDLPEGAGIVEGAIDVEFPGGDKVEDGGAGDLDVIAEGKLEVAEGEGVGIDFFGGGGYWFES